MTESRIDSFYSIGKALLLLGNETPLFLLIFNIHGPSLAEAQDSVNAQGIRIGRVDELHVHVHGSCSLSR